MSSSEQLETNENFTNEPTDEVAKSDLHPLPDESDSNSKHSLIDDLSEDSDTVSVKATPKKPRTYWEKCQAYWRQYKDPNVWRSMPFCLLIGLLFWCLGFIPNYDKCMLSQSIFAIIGGVILGAIPQVQLFIHNPKIHPGIGFSKQTFMQFAVILYGFRVKLDDIAEIGWVGAISAILMVIVTFLLALFLGKLMTIPQTQSGIIGCGFCICGIAAILGACQLFESSGAEVSLACVFVIVGGFLDIIIYPILYSIKEKLDFNDKSFGVTAGISIKEIAHTVSVGLSCSTEVSKYAMIVKMFKVFCLPFLLIVLGFVLPLVRKYKEKKDKNATKSLEKNKSTVDKCNEFWVKVTIPYFAFIFILFTIINTYVEISEKAHEILNEIIIIFLSTSMFCVGITTDLRELLHVTNFKPAALALILYVWVFGFSWVLEIICSKIQE